MPGFPPLTTVLADRKVLLVALYLLCDYRAFLDRLEALSGSPVMLGVFLALYAFLAAALVAVAMIPATGVRIVAATVLAAGSVALHSYEWSTGSPLDYNSFETMLASSGDAGDAATQHLGILLRAIGVAAILFFAIALPPRRKDGLPLRLHYAVPVAALLGLSAMLYVRGGEGASALPPAFTPVAHAAIKGTLTAAKNEGPRADVKISPLPSRRPDHDIVLIVDESIAATYLDINAPDGVYSGLAKGWPDLSIANYGIAVSSTNCSAGSNRMLRFGGTRENYRDVSRTHPSIWAYAKKAGLRTVYLDGQRTGGELQNLATPEERAEIDDFVQLGRDVPVIQRDHRLADLIAQRLANGVPEFIFVNKVGAHFPVADKFPDEAAIYRPLPERGKTGHIIDMGPIDGKNAGSQTEWRLYRNAYRNTLLWSVGGFFDRLLPQVAPASGVIIYTADHGQDLHERGRPGKATHCTSNPRAEEVAVPLVVIDRPDEPRLGWQASLAANANAVSHFRIFPTLLSLMGFADRDFAQVYGDTLVSPERDELTFTSTYFATLGRDPTWRDFDPAKVSLPQRSDYAGLADGGTPTKMRSPVAN